MTIRRWLIATALVAALAPAAAAHDWNDGKIAWKTYDEGLALAKKDEKPICLIVFTEWCPHCGNYSKVFQDDKVVELSKQFVMIRLDQDKSKDITSKFAPDGSYIPRTMFLAPDGILVADLHAPRDQYKFFYDEKDPASVLAGMQAATAKLGKPAKAAEATKPAKPAASKPAPPKP